jgi:hypothetical protein
VYLTGFTLFLAFVLVRVFNLIAELSLAQDRAIGYEDAQREAMKHKADLAESERNFRT